MTSKLSTSLSFYRLLEAELIDVGKKLSHLPSSYDDLVNNLKEMEIILAKVNHWPSESLIDAMKTIMDTLIAKELVNHPDINVNISVASCGCELFRIVAPLVPFNGQQLKEFFEFVVTTFEKLASASRGCFTKMTKVFKIFSRTRLASLMLHFHMEPLVVRLFKRFLTFADSNYPAVVFEMEYIMTTTIMKSQNDELKLEIARLLVSGVSKENQIWSPVRWKLAGNILKNCDPQLKIHLQHMKDTETIQSTSQASKLSKDTTHSMKLIDYQVEKKHDEKTLSSADPPMTSKSETKVTGKRKRTNAPLKEAISMPIHAQSVEQGDNLVGRTIKVWWPNDKQHYIGVVKSFDCITQKHKVSVERKGVEELLDLKLHRRGLLENKSSVLDSTSSGNGDNEELLAIKQEPCGLVEYVSPMSDCLRIDDGHVGLLNVKKEQSALVEYVSPMSDLLGQNSFSQSGIICVQSYTVKQSVEPVLEAIFKKHGDIAAKCIFKTASVRSSLLEVICEVVRQIQTDSITEKMEEIECQVSDAEKANINVSWLRAHLEVIRKRKEEKKSAILLIETKAITVSAKRAAQVDLKERREELMEAHKRFVKAEKCVKLLEVVEKNLSDNILEAKAKKDSWVEQPIL